MPPIAVCDAADRAARAASRAITPALDAGELYAVRAAYQSTAIVDIDHGAKLDAVTGNALRAHAQATAGTAITRVVELTRHAIRSWRDLGRDAALPETRDDRRRFLAHAAALSA